MMRFAVVNDIFSLIRTGVVDISCGLVDRKFQPLKPVDDQPGCVILTEVTLLAKLAFQPLSFCLEVHATTSQSRELLRRDPAKLAASTGGLTIKRLYTSNRRLELSPSPTKLVHLDWRYFVS
jgi:hypothetical protein